MTITGRERLLRLVAFAFSAQMLLTSIHHLYGGLIYGSMLRMSMPILAAVELLIVLGLLFWYRRSGSGIALILFSMISALVGVVQGLFHAIYGHLYKNILVLMGVTADTVMNYYLPVTPNDFVYPPNDLFFEATGVLELMTITLIAIFTYRLIQNWRLGKRMGAAHWQTSP